MQRPATELTEVMKFRFGTSVMTGDGELATVTAVVVDPSTRGVIGLRIRFGIPPFTQRFYVPASAIRNANAAEIELTLPKAEIVTRGKVGPDAPNLTEKTTIRSGNRRLGHLVQLTVARQTMALRHLVIEHGLGTEVLVPAVDITAIEVGRGDAVQISVGEHVAHQQPLIPFRPDRELYDEIHRAIEGYQRLRIDMDGITIHAIDGVVWLEGYVSSELNRRLVQDQLINITGLAELHNNLVTDPEVAAAVSMALARDPRTAEERIGVYPALGVVHLRGFVRTREALDAAGQIAASVPGIKQVDNGLQVNQRATVIPVLAAVTNAEDQVPGGD